MALQVYEGRSFIYEYLNAILGRSHWFVAVSLPRDNHVSVLYTRTFRLLILSSFPPAHTITTGVEMSLRELHLSLISSWAASDT